MSLIRALFLDLDETLIQDVASHQASMQACFDTLAEREIELDVDHVQKQFSQINTWHWENYDESPISSMTEATEVRTFIWKLVLEEMQSPHVELAPVLGETYQQTRRKTYQCYDDTHEVLSALHHRVPLLLLTNGNAHMQRAKIERCQVEPYFDLILIAQELGVSKPEPLMFTTALEHVGLPPEHVLMVGDNWGKDIVGGMNAGTQTAWIQRREDKPVPGDQHPTWIVRSMQEVRDIVEHQYA